MSPHETTSILLQLEDFISSNHHNWWLDDGILTIYVRKGNHYINGSFVECLDIANIQQIDPRYEHKGYFKAFMIKAESLGFPVFVECIHNDALVEMLKKNGYTIINEDRSIHAIKYPNS